MGEGIFIAVDGIDGAGKTTQVKRLCEALRAAGEVVIESKEPTNGQHGRRLRESAQNGRMAPSDELAAFIADRKEHVETVIRPALANGSVVVLDRYLYSTIAYQGERTGYAPCELYEQMQEYKFPIPDITFLIDVDAEIGLHRVAQMRGDIPNEFERIESLRTIRQLFLALTECAPEIQVIDGRPSIEVVYHDIAHRFVDSVLKSKRCYKPYDCDIFYCAYRITGECQWPTERARILAQ